MYKKKKKRPVLCYSFTLAAMRLCIAILAVLTVALVTASKFPTSFEPGPAKRSPYLNPIASYIQKMAGEDDDDLSGSSVLSARQLIRGARLLFWRFSLTTVTSYTATSTSTSTTTCTLSTSSTCSGRRRRSFLEYPEDDSSSIVPSSVLKVETTQAAELESNQESSRAARYMRVPHRLPVGNRYLNNLYNIQPDYAVHSSFDGPFRKNYPSSMSHYFGKNSGLDYDPYYFDDYDEDFEYLPRPLKFYGGAGGRRRPQIPGGLLDDVPEDQTAAFRWLFRSKSLFSTFTLTVTTTTGTSTAFDRVTVTSTPTCSSAGVYAQCPTG